MDVSDDISDSQIFRGRLFRRQVLPRPNFLGREREIVAQEMVKPRDVRGTEDNVADQEG